MYIPIPNRLSFGSVREALLSIVAWMTGKAFTHTITFGKIIFDYDNSREQILTADGELTSIAVANVPEGPWGIVIEAINWGGYVSGLVLGDIEVPGGAFAPTTTGKDILVLRGRGSSDISLSIAQEDIS